MRTNTNTSWWRQLGAISQGMLFLDGHIATAEAARAARPDTDSTGIERSARSEARAKRVEYCRQVRQMTALSSFR